MVAGRQRFDHRALLVLWTIHNHIRIRTTNNRRSQAHLSGRMRGYAAAKSLQISGFILDDYLHESIRRGPSDRVAALDPALTAFLRMARIAGQLPLRRQT